MKIYYLLIILYTLSFKYSYSQPHSHKDDSKEPFPGYYSDTYKKIEGYYIDLDDNKIDVIFKSINFAKLACGLSCLKDDTKFDLTPDICKEIGFNVYNHDVRFITKPNIYSSMGDCEKVFIRPKIIGSVTLYSHYYYHRGQFGITYIEERSILENEQRQTLRITYGGAKRNDLAWIFSDYSEFAYQITNKDIPSADIKNTAKMVKHYNDWKQKQPPTNKIYLNDIEKDSVIKSIYKTNSDSSLNSYFDRILAFKKYDVFYNIKIDTAIHKNGNIKGIGLVSENKITQNPRASYKLGTWHFYYEDGRCMEIIDYNLFGKRHGTYKKFDNKGDLIKERTYIDGLYQ